MIMIEFKKEKHEENVRLLHNLKEDICKLLENMMHESHERRHDGYDFDERRGRGGRYSRRDEEMDERRGRMNRRYPDDIYGDRYDY